MNYKNPVKYEIPEFDPSQKNKIKNNNTKSFVDAYSVCNFDRLFQEINDSRHSFIDIFNAIDKFYIYIRGKKIPQYYKSFLDLKINEILVDVLKQKQAKDIQKRTIEIVTQIAYSSRNYSFDLINAGILPVIIDLYFDECENNEKIIEALAYFVEQDKAIKNEILDKIDIKLIFSQLLQTSVPSSQKNAYLDFLYSILKWEDFNIETFQMYLFYAKELLNQWKQNSKYPTQLLQIIINKFCDFQKYENLYQPFQEYVREIDLVDLIMLIFEDLVDLVNCQNFANDEFKLNRNGCLDNHILDFLFVLLNFAGIVFEQPVDTQLNLPLFMALANSEYSKIRLETIFVIGNLFESMPETISQMMNLNYFDLLKQNILKSSGNEKMESIICCATAICFSDHSTRLYFVHNNFLLYIYDSLNTYNNNLMYMTLRSMARLIEAICIESGASAALDAFNDIVDDSFYEIDNSMETDEKNIEALMDLKHTISEIEKNAY